RIWNQPSPETGTTRKSLLAFSPDGAQLAVGTETSVRLVDAVVDAASGRSLCKLDSTRPLCKVDSPGPVSALAFSPDGRTLAYGASGHGVLLWIPGGAAPQRVLLQEKKTPDDIEEVRFGADARTLMVGTNSPLQIARWKQESDGRWK